MIFLNEFTVVPKYHNSHLFWGVPCDGAQWDLDPWALPTILAYSLAVCRPRDHVHCVLRSRDVSPSLDPALREPCVTPDFCVW